MDYAEIFKELNAIGTFTIEPLCEGGLSRIWQYTHNSMTFAIIDSQDKDTREDRSKELVSLIRQLMSNQVNTKRKSDGTKMITYKEIEGSYTYDDGTHGTEQSYLINNISREQALELGKSVNQESILWKDDDFFGYIYCDTGKPYVTFSQYERNMSFNQAGVQAFGSRLKDKHNKGQGFTFVAEHYVYNGSKTNKVKEKLFKISYKVE